MSSNLALLNSFVRGEPTHYDPLLAAKLIVWNGDGYQMTSAGHLLLNGILPEGEKAIDPSPLYGEDYIPTINGRKLVDKVISDRLNMEARARLDNLTIREQGVPVQPASALDVQIGGDHYKDMAIQPVEFIEKNGIRFLEGCIIKRAARHDKKTGAGAQDLRKIIHEATLLLQLRYGEKP